MFPPAGLCSFDDMDDSVVKAAGGEFVMVPDPPCLRGVHTIAGGMWRVPARQLTKENSWCLARRAQRTKIIDRSPTTTTSNQKIPKIKPH